MAFLSHASQLASPCFQRVAGRISMVTVQPCCPPCSSLWKLNSQLRWEGVWTDITEGGWWICHFLLSVLWDTHIHKIKPKSLTPSRHKLSSLNQHNLTDARASSMHPPPWAVYQGLPATCFKRCTRVSECREGKVTMVQLCGLAQNVFHPNHTWHSVSSPGPWSWSDRGHIHGMCTKPHLLCNTIPANPLQVVSSALLPCTSNPSKQLICLSLMRPESRL